MSIEELIQMILGERINSALQETSLERDKDILEKGEAVLKKLPEEQREIIQNYLNSFPMPGCRSVKAELALSGI